MNRIKFYRDGEVVVVRVTQTKGEMDREIRCKRSVLCPTGYRAITGRFPSVAQANRKMLAQGYTRARP